MRPPVTRGTDHVVAGDLGLGDRVAPVLERQELIVVQRVREARHVPGDEDTVCGHAVDVHRPAAGVTGHPPPADGQA